MSHTPKCSYPNCACPGRWDCAKPSSEIGALIADRDNSNRLLDECRRERNVLQKICAQRADEIEKLQSARKPMRDFEDQPFAWAVKLKSGVESLVYHPIAEALELEAGDVAYPLYREIYTQEGLDAAKAEAERLVSGIRVE
jgi:hypothetical protein